MPRGYRHAILALVGWLSLAGADKPPHQAHGRPSTQQANPATQPAGTPTPSPSSAQAPKFTAYAGYDPDPCYHAEDKDAADLCAQWRAAIGSEKAAAESRRATTWAIIATILSFIGVGGLIYTIWQTQGSLAEARRGNRIAMKANARATRQAISSAKDTNLALQLAEANASAAAALADASQSAADAARRIGRAYVRISLMNPADTNPPSGKWVFGKYTNVGSTPATITGTSVDVFEPHAMPNDPVIYAAGQQFTPLGYSVLGASDFSSTGVMIAYYTVKQNVIFNVRYVDVFGETHTATEVFYTEDNGASFHPYYDPRWKIYD